MDNYNMRDGDYVIFDWKENLNLERYSLDDKYILNIDDEKLTLKVNEEVVCEKSYFLLDEAKNITNEMPTYIYPCDDNGFGIFSYFIYGGGSTNLKGIITKDDKQEIVEFVVNYGLKGMKLGESLSSILLNKELI